MNRTATKSILRKNVLLVFACVIGIGYFATAQNMKTYTYPNGISFQLPEEEIIPASTTAATFVDMGKPSGGYNVVTDMEVFNGRLYLTTSANPLGSYGTSVFYTTAGSTYTNVLSDATSQGFLRLSVYDNKLYIPDGDPNGYDPSYVYISSTGNASSFTKTNILGAVHSFQVIKYNNKLLVANGMKSGYGGLCKFDGSSTWNSVYESAGTFRLKYAVDFNGKLLVANSTSGSGDTDYVIWTGDVESTTPTLKNAVTGSSFTFRWYASSIGKLYWTVAASGQIFCLVSSDGLTWAAAPVLNGKFVSDYCELNGKMYALAQDGLWESNADHSTFTKIASVPVTGAFSPVAVSGGNNVEAQASMAVYNGAIWCGSSTNGKVYKIDVVASIAKNKDQKIDNIYPNPFTSSTTFNTSQEMKDATISIYNSLGQEIKSIMHVSGKTYSFERDGLPMGIYTLQVREENNTLATAKFVIVD